VRGDKPSLEVYSAVTPSKYYMVHGSRSTTWSGSKVKDKGQGHERGGHLRPQSCHPTNT
jgi:hypothetical protein